MNDMISIFSMNGIDNKVKAKIIIELGKIINYKYGVNITEPLVCELVEILDPLNEIFKDDTFISLANKDKA